MVLLNKQAAYSGVIAIVESGDESTLGPIMVTITSRDLDRVLKWLVPVSEKKTGIRFNRARAISMISGLSAHDSI